MLHRNSLSCNSSSSELSSLLHLQCQNSSKLLNVKNSGQVQEEGQEEDQYEDPDSVQHELSAQRGVLFHLSIRLSPVGTGYSTQSMQYEHGITRVLKEWQFLKEKTSLFRLGRLGSMFMKFHGNLCAYIYIQIYIYIPSGYLT